VSTVLVAALAVMPVVTSAASLGSIGQGGGISYGPAQPEGMLASRDALGKIAPALTAQFRTAGTDGQVNFLVQFAQRADLEAATRQVQVTAAGQTAAAQELAERSAVITELKVTAAASQARVLRYLERRMDGAENFTLATSSTMPESILHTDDGRGGSAHGH
jgi:bacillopeptidase F